MSKNKFNTASNSYFNKQKISDIFDLLVNKGSIIPCNIEKDIKRNTRTLLVLKEKIKSTNISTRYTATYDALFRLFDITLNRHGYTLKNNPHQTFKQLYPILFSGINHLNIDINQVVNTRHRVKKRKYIPTENEYDIINRLYKHAMKNNSYDERS
jgi:hypothetical protein